MKLNSRPTPMRADEHERDHFPFIRDYCGDHCVSEVSEVEALEEARENFGAAVDRHPEKFMTVCQKCFELLLEDSVEACRAYEAREGREH